MASADSPGAQAFRGALGESTREPGRDQARDQRADAQPDTPGQKPPTEMPAHRRASSAALTEARPPVNKIRFLSCPSLARNVTVTTSHIVKKRLTTSHRPGDHGH